MIYSWVTWTTSHGLDLFAKSFFVTIYPLANVVAPIRPNTASHTILKPIYIETLVNIIVFFTIGVKLEARQPMFTTIFIKLASVYTIRKLFDLDFALWNNCRVKFD